MPECDSFQLRSSVYVHIHLGFIFLAGGNNCKVLEGISHSVVFVLSQEKVRARFGLAVCCCECRSSVGHGTAED